MQLIGSHASPYVRKVRVTLAERGIECAFVLENVWAADTTIQKLNPLGKVPCLILDDGSSMYDSRVICEYLDASRPVPSLIPAAGPARIAVRRWEALGDGVLDAIVLVRLEVIQREPQERSEKWLLRQMGKVDAGLAVAAGDLGNNVWCVGKMPHPRGYHPGLSPGLHPVPLPGDRLARPPWQPGGAVRQAHAPAIVLDDAAGMILIP